MILETSNHIILLNFDFPPNPGIGGRRWAALAQGLAEKGIQVHVIKSAYSGKKISNWHAAVDHPNIHLHEITPVSKLHLTPYNKKLLNSIHFRTELIRMKFLEKGTPFDKSIGMKEAVINKLQQLTSTHTVNWIIATGAPFNFPYYASLFVEKNPGFKLWVDLRDPWLNAQNYGMSNLSTTRYTVEKEKARHIFQYAQVVSSPSIHVLQEFNSVVREELKTKYFELKHFSTSAHQTTPSHPSPHLLTITYGGAIYLRTETFLEQMANDLRALRELQPLLYKKLRILFFSPDFQKIKEVFSEHDIVSVQGDIGGDIVKRWSESDYTLILLAEHNKDFLTTKFYECLSLQKTLLYLGPNGRVQEEIISKNHGILWDQLVSKLKNNEFFKKENSIGLEDVQNASVSGRVEELLNKMNSI